MKPNCVFYITVFTISFQGFLVGQTDKIEYLNLDQCIIYLYENNLAINENATQIKLLGLDKTQNFWNRIPTINSNASNGIQLGRTINPSTNDFEISPIIYSSLGVNVSLPIYQGNRMNIQAHKTELAIENSKLNAQILMDQLWLNCVQLFTHILILKEQISLADEQLHSIGFDLNRIKKFVDLGLMSIVELNNIELHYSNSELNKFEIENRLQIKTLELKALINIDHDFDIVHPSLEAISCTKDFLTNLKNKFELNYLNNSKVKKAHIAIQNKEKDYELVKTNELPRIYGSFGLQTNSSWNKNNSSYISSYSKQFSENFGQTANIVIEIPILNNRTNKINKSRAEINYDIEVLRKNDVIRNMRSEFYLKLLEATAAIDKLNNADIRINLAEQNQKSMLQQLEHGLINSLDYIQAEQNVFEAKNRKLITQFELWLLKSNLENMATTIK